ncbi:hypothetical protein DOTSEDRAFT_136569 [Dothistroma septosporum NZE10]|uniref:Uncharacterized protein n=1 Tax=Dothistroma septosporum (strain NZE10 / CBS 128990) TaxID=675120 RepID=N1PH07_DOTSN|nr:hypothetical protein DOTSEDRAFT_136569 [Dothistroma septosporum NZE10]
MQLISFLASAAALVAPSLAAALPVTFAAPSGLPDNYQWSVENWYAGCARSGCSYNFNVTGASSGLYPGFKAYCSGADTGYYDDCEILGVLSDSGTPFVAASLRPNFQNGIATMSVSLSFTDADSLIIYNISGWHDATYNAFVVPLEQFNITEPFEITQVL